MYFRLIIKQGNLKESLEMNYHSNPLTPKMKKIQQGGSICGGVMSESMMLKGMKKYGVYFGMMSYIMPDNMFKKYLAEKDYKKRTQLFEKYARSII